MATQASPAKSPDPEARFHAAQFWSPEEIELFERATEHEGFTKHPVWKKLKTFLDESVANAEAEMRANKSAKPEDAYHLQMYWREREYVRNMIVTMVYGPIRDREAIVEDLKQQAKQKQEERLTYERRSQAD